MLSVYAVIRRVARSAPAALLLYLPFLATSFFILRGTLVRRYSFADYFGVFPLRYAGPFFVLFLVARHLDGAWPRRVGWIFLLAGLAAINNSDFGVPALGATAVAVVFATDQLRNRGWWAKLIGEAVTGLVAAFALVSIVTLARAGSLPDLGLAFRYAHLFAIAGYQLLPMPWFGFWVVIYLTFCSALVVASLLLRQGIGRRLEAGTLAWVGIFGLGSGAYYAGRSHSEVLVALFSSWALAVVLLVIVTARDPIARHRRPGPAQVALFVGFGLMVCSVAQFPPPWRSIDRLERSGEETFQPAADIAFLSANTTPGESVALLSDLGQRISRDAGVTDVTPYSGNASMPTEEQLVQTLELLHREGGTKVFVHQEHSWPEFLPALEARGFRRVSASEPPSPPGVEPRDRLVFLTDAGRR